MDRLKHVRLTTRTKVLASVAAVGTAAAVSGLGTFGTFTSTTSASGQETAGTVVIALPAAGVTNRLATAATGLVPGDTVARAFQLSNTGNQNLSSVVLTTTASPTSLLDTDATNGLQLVIQSCSAAGGWTEAGTAPAYTYTCSGTTTTVLASRAVIGSGLTLSGLNSLTAGGTDNLLATLTLPTAAPNTMQGLSSTITYSFTGTQRTATNR